MAREKTGGRTKGTLNKLTAKSKAEFDKMMIEEMKNVTAAFKKVREESEAKYLDLLSKFIGYLYAKKTDITTGGETIEGFIVKSVRNADRDNAK